jgi:hypothetical protein
MPYPVFEKLAVAAFFMEYRRRRDVGGKGAKKTWERNLLYGAKAV